MTISEFQAEQKIKNARVFALIRKRKVIKAVKSVAICAAICGATYLTLREARRPELSVMLWLIAAGVCLLILLFLKPRGLFFGKKRMGVIVSVELNVRRVASDKSAMGMMNRTFADFSVKEEDGRICRVSLDAKYEACYRIGDEVALLKGIDFPILAKAPDDRQTVCWCCGSIKSAGEADCLMCGREFYL